MSEWTTPGGIAHLRVLCASDGDDAHLIVEAMPAVLNALEAIERERDQLLQVLALAHLALNDTAGVLVPADVHDDIGPAIRALTEMRDADVTEARAILAARDGETLPDAARRVEKARACARQDAADWRGEATAAADERDEARRIAGALALRVSAYLDHEEGPLDRGAEADADLRAALAWAEAKKP